MHGIVRLVCAAVMGLSVWIVASTVHAQQEPLTTEELAAQISTLKQEYEKRIAALEAQLAAIKAEAQSPDRKAPMTAAMSGQARDNSFNPAIGVVLNAMYTEFSEEHSEIQGFRFGHESERPVEGLGLGHSEITVSSNIDDKFFGNLTLGLGVHPGEPLELELEEA